MARYLFFGTSRSAFQQVSDLFDFVWPTAAALWNLRWQVRGFAGTKPQVTKEELHSRFVLGSGIHSANIERACLTTTWDDQQGQFAKFLLIDLFALYEGWLDETLGIVRLRRLGKALQFPTSIVAGVATKGVGFALAEIRANSSSMLSTCIYSGLAAHPKNSASTLEALMRCYRCFKECRNSIMHHGGVASAAAAAAYQSYSSLSAHDLGLGQPPVCPPVLMGSRTALSLHGVVGFSDVILRLIATLDSELACASAAEDEFRAQWLLKIGKGTH